MSLDKAISHGKERRKPYHGAKAINQACRNHGDDDWARDNRLYQANKEKLKAKQHLEEYYDNQ